MIVATTRSTSKPFVSIVLLNWNGCEDTLDCLKSLLKQDYQNYNVIVIDNGSTDNSVSKIKSSFPEIKLIETGKNLGYAGGNNIGIQEAIKNGADYIAVLNNDTVVAENLISQLLQAALTISTPAILGGKIYFYDPSDTLWFAGARWNSDKLCFGHIGYGEKDLRESTQTIPSDYITGCLIFAPAKIFQEIGGFDERFFLTYEETDWCYRAKKQGYPCYVIPEAKLWHKVSASFGGEQSPLVTYFMERNILLWSDLHLDKKNRRALKQKSFKKAKKILFPAFGKPEPKLNPKLLYWTFLEWKKRIGQNLADPHKKAFLFALKDYYLRNLGDCPLIVRKLGRSS